MTRKEAEEILRYYNPHIALPLELQQEEDEVARIIWSDARKLMKKLDMAHRLC